MRVLVAPCASQHLVLSVFRILVTSGVWEYHFNLQVPSDVTLNIFPYTHLSPACLLWLGVYSVLLTIFKLNLRILILWK
jgi:hypothetical protein